MYLRVYEATAGVMTALGHFRLAGRGVARRGDRGAGWGQLLPRDTRRAIHLGWHNAGQKALSHRTSSNDLGSRPFSHLLRNDSSEFAT